MVRFLHVADLHLGMRITRFSTDAIDKIREARFKALEHVREEAARTDEPYQFVVIAGDLFDDVRVRRTIAQRAFDLLQSFPVPVLIIPGNHDPLEPGAVWESDPWDTARVAGYEDAQRGRREETEPCESPRPAFDASPSRVRLLGERRPFREIPGATIFPCPVYRKTSTDDPTRWIADHPRRPEDGVRIGIAHGSVMDRPNLPDDDHPISPMAPDDLDLDYLALGHWHRHGEYRDRAGAVRMVYSGVHEPMRFKGDIDGIGWRPYSSGRGRDDFADDGQGRALSVMIERPGAAPVIEQRIVQRLRWEVRGEPLHDAQRLEAILEEVAEARGSELTLLRLRLAGTLPLEAMQRLDELREILGRYVVGELDTSDLHVEPVEAEIRDVVGNGVLRAVLDRLRASLESSPLESRLQPAPDALKGELQPADTLKSDLQQAAVERATLLLCRYAREAQRTT